MALDKTPKHIRIVEENHVQKPLLDHRRLTYPFQGREFRLTDVHGHVVHDLIA